ncbi:hypothetical protein LV779_07390 [Streptomyces thinghirensis]|nr:hypothetical protein [Streptomyces thinghirensis]
MLDRRVERASAPGGEHARRLVEQVASARRPALVLGGDIDSAGRFDDTVRLAERLGGPVWAAPRSSGCPSPTGIRSSGACCPPGSRRSPRPSRHDLVLVLGAPVFRYHEYLPAGTCRRAPG